MPFLLQGALQEVSLIRIHFSFLPTNCVCISVATLGHSTCGQLGKPPSPPSVGTPKEWGPEFIPPVSHIDGTLHAQEMPTICEVN